MMWYNVKKYYESEFFERIDYYLEDNIMSDRVKGCFPENYISGEYAVGTECFSIVDTGRKEFFSESDDEDRKISVRMYYPVKKENVSGKERAAIFSEAKKKALMKEYHIRNISDDMNLADYYENIPVAKDKKFPLIVFSMGYKSYVEANTYLLCDLASHGYIVASAGHAYEAIENDYQDGTSDVFCKKINKMMYINILGAIISQSKLLKKSLTYKEALAQFEQFQNKYTPYIKGRVAEWEKDIVKALEAVKERYSEYIDFSCGIGASGHSLGGCLAYYLCRYNDEFSCGINIDGGLFGSYKDSTMEKPFCQISCKENINVETRPFLNTNADTYHIVFSDMKHIGFTDAKFYIPIKALSGKLDPEEMYKHLAYSHITFFDKYLKKADISFDGLPSDKITYKKIV